MSVPITRVESMLLTLIRRYSKPYLPYILAVVIFQLAATIAALYLAGHGRHSAAAPPATPSADGASEPDQGL